MYASVAIVLVSCKNEVLEQTERRTVTRSTTTVEHGFTISQDDALKSLKDVLSVIDNKRSNSKAKSVTGSSGRTVKSIETIGSKPLNRTNKTMALSSSSTDAPLLYLVNFEDDAGYAVLAADSRIDAPVLAVTDDGNMTEDEFLADDYEVWDSRIDYGYDTLQNFTLYNAAEDDYYVAAIQPSTRAVFEYAQDMVDDAIDGGGSIGTGSSTYTVTGNWVNNNKVSPMLTTAWHQDSPFSDRTPRSRWFFWQSWKQGPAGCIPIAVAQIMAYNDFPTTLTLNGLKISWSEVKSVCNYSNRTYKGTTSAQGEVAELVKHIGSWCGTIYTPGFAFALPRKGADCMRTFGYINATRHYGYHADLLKNMLDNNKPVLVAAISGIVSGHAWVVDGYIDRSRTVETKNSSSNSVISSTTENQFLVHCNWGWQGRYNGYYYSGVFKPKDGAVDYEGIESTWHIDDKNGSDNFNWAYHMITY